MTYKRCIKINFKLFQLLHHDPFYTLDHILLCTRTMYSLLSVYQSSHQSSILILSFIYVIYNSIIHFSFTYFAKDTFSDAKKTAEMFSSSFSQWLSPSFFVSFFSLSHLLILDVAKNGVLTFVVR